MLASRFVRTGRHLDTRALMMTRPFSQGVPHRGSGKVKAGRDRKGNRMKTSAVAEGSEEELQKGEQEAEDVSETGTLKADWDSVGASSENDGISPPGRLPKPRGNRKRPVRSPSFHSRGGFDDLEDLTREEAINDGLGLDEHFDGEWETEAGVEKKTNKNNETAAKHGGKARDDIATPDKKSTTILDKPEAIAVFKKLRTVLETEWDAEVGFGDGAGDGEQDKELRMVRKNTYPPRTLIRPDVLFGELDDVGGVTSDGDVDGESLSDLDGLDVLSHLFAELDGMDTTARDGDGEGEPDDDDDDDQEEGDELDDKEEGLLQLQDFTIEIKQLKQILGLKDSEEFDRERFEKLAKKRFVELCQLDSDCEEEKDDGDYITADLDLQEEKGNGANKDAMHDEVWGDQMKLTDRFHNKESDLQGDLGKQVADRLYDLYGMKPVRFTTTADEESSDFVKTFRGLQQFSQSASWQLPIAVRQKMFDLHVSDPETWPTERLAREYGVKRARVEAIIKLFSLRGTVRTDPVLEDAIRLLETDSGFNDRNKQPPNTPEADRQNSMHTGHVVRLKNNETEPDAGRLLAQDYDEYLANDRGRAPEKEPMLVATSKRGMKFRFESL